uniref:DUF1985 domain-containing protein n=2 Tax=Brassica oleracea TaxID=3712 RepID=A0A0D3CQP6_BRAOL|nr:unnamed protein product [Brassica oleracea]
MDIDDDGGGGDYRRRSSRKTKPSGNDGGESRIRRRSSRNTTMSTAAEATKRPSGGLKQPAGDKDGCDDVGIRLPERLFATDRFPSERVNMYSTVDLLLWVWDVLSGSPEMDILLGSCFAGLFQMPARRLFAGKVVHSMMTRQVVTKKLRDVACFFGGEAIAFLFGGFQLIGRNRDATVEDLIALVESDEQMFGEKKLKLCLLVIVDGVLVATSHKPMPTLKYVKLLENLDEFFDFPWGRESFLWTLSTLKPQPKLVTFWCIPQLAAFVGGDDTATIMQYPEKSMPLHAGLNLAHVRKAEHDPALKVEPMMEISGDHEDRWGLWDDENYDKKVEYMVQLLKEGHLFLKPNWLGGDAGDPLFVYIEKLKTPKRKKQVVSEDEPLPKQRRISGFFRRTQTGVDPGKFAALEGRGRSQKKYRRSCRKKTNVDVTESQMGADVNLDNRNNDDVVTSSEETESGGVDVFGTLAQQPGGLHRGNEAIAEKVEEKMSSEGISAAGQVGGGLLPASEGEARAVDEDVTGASRPERTNLEEVFEGVATRTGEVEEVSEVRPEITEGEEKPLGEDRVREEVGGNDAKSNVASGAVVVVAGKPEAESSVAHARAEVGVYKNSEQEKMGVSKENQKHVVVDQVGIDDEIGSGDDLTDDDAADAKEVVGRWCSVIPPQHWLLGMFHWQTRRSWRLSSWRSHH